MMSDYFIVLVGLTWFTVKTALVSWARGEGLSFIFTSDSGGIGSSLVGGIEDGFIAARLVMFFCFMTDRVLSDWFERLCGF